MTGRSDLTSPRQARRIDLHYDPDAFGKFSEGIARYLGTARFLVWQSVIIVGWIGFNYFAPAGAQFDPYDRGLVLLTLVLSLQASYAAPLILLAQNRQEVRDKNESDNDRRVAERTQADTEFLAREISSVRVALADMVTSEDMRSSLDKLAAAVERMSDRLDRLDVDHLELDRSGDVLHERGRDR